MRRFVFTGLAAIVLALFCNGTAFAESYPTKPIRWIVPYPPGGAADVQSRILGERLSQTLGQRVLVENRPGAAGIIGTELVARAKPDGYTVLIGTSQTHAINPLLNKSLSYDAVKDFKPITLIAKTPNMLVVHPSLPVRSVKELIDYLKAHPGMSWASAGNASSTHFAGELLRLTAGLQVTHVPYRGGGQAVADLSAGHIKVGVADILAALPYHKAGTLRALAVTSATRSVAAPDLPTLAEEGFPEYEAVAWQGLYAPAGTPDEIVRKLQAEIARILKLPDVQERLVALGSQAVGNTPEEFKAFMASETKKWGEIARDAKIRLE